MTESKKTVFFTFVIIHVLILLLCTIVISTWQRNDYGLSSESYISDIYYKSIGLKEEAFADMDPVTVRQGQIYHDLVETKLIQPDRIIVASQELFLYDPDIFREKTIYVRPGSFYDKLYQNNSARYKETECSVVRYDIPSNMPDHIYSLDLADDTLCAVYYFDRIDEAMYNTIRSYFSERNYVPGFFERRYTGFGKLFYVMTLPNGRYALYALAACFAGLCIVLRNVMTKSKSVYRIHYKYGGTWQRIFQRQMQDHFRFWLLSWIPALLCFAICGKTILNWSISVALGISLASFLASAVMTMAAESMMFPWELIKEDV